MNGRQGIPIRGWLYFLPSLFNYDWRDRKIGRKICPMRARSGRKFWTLIKCEVLISQKKLWHFLPLKQAFHKVIDVKLGRLGLAIENYSQYISIGSETVSKCTRGYTGIHKKQPALKVENHKNRTNVDGLLRFLRACICYKQEQCEADLKYINRHYLCTFLLHVAAPV